MTKSERKVIFSLTLSISNKSLVVSLLFNSESISSFILWLEHYFINHCKTQEQDIRKLYEAIGLLMDRTKPSTIGFITDNDKQ